jgi:hypothetical protein
MKTLILQSATILTLFGSLLIANNVMICGYILFIYGAFVWAIHAIETKQTELAFLNIAYFLINIYGLINNL